MTFLWPEMLLLLPVIPVLAAAFLRLLRRRRLQALDFSHLMNAGAGTGLMHQTRHRLPPLLFLVSLTALVIAMARPAVTMTLASRYKTIILAIDASISMRADDIAPSRIGAARDLAHTFVNERPRDTRIGIVSFALYADEEQAPTLDRQSILEAIDRFPLQNGTAIGGAILLALKMIFPDAGIDPDSPNPQSHAAPGKGQRPGNAAARAVAPGSYQSAAVILLTDGNSTTGPPPVAAARLAAQLGVRVYTVGFGIPDRGQGIKDESASDLLDEKTLVEIANMTRAEYFYAGTAADLSRIYRTLDSRFVVERKNTEIGAFFAAAAALCAMISGSLSLYWFNRIL